MSVLFAELFENHPITVLHVRGRPAFLPRELAVAAGYSENGQRFVDQIFREWAAALDEDDDIAQLVGQELDALKRELPALANAPFCVVLFATGAEKCLVRSQVRNSQRLVAYLREVVLPNAHTLTGAARPAPAVANRAGAVSAAGEWQPGGQAEERKEGFREMIHLAQDLREAHLVSDDEWVALRVEAIEHLLGRPLRTPLNLGLVLAPLQVAAA